MRPERLPLMPATGLLGPDPASPAAGPSADPASPAAGPSPDPASPAAGPSPDPALPAAPGLWRYRAVIPVDPEIGVRLSMGEGATPLIAAGGGPLEGVSFKLEF